MPKKKPQAARTDRQFHPVDKEMQDKPKHSDVPVHVGRIQKNAAGTRPHLGGKFKSKNQKGPKVYVNTTRMLAKIGRENKGKGKSTKDVMGVMATIKRKNTKKKVDVGNYLMEPGVKKAMKKNFAPTPENFKNNPELAAAKRSYRRLGTMQKFSKIHNLQNKK